MEPVPAPANTEASTDEQRDPHYRDTAGLLCCQFSHIRLEPFAWKGYVESPKSAPLLQVGQIGAVYVITGSNRVWCCRHVIEYVIPPTLLENKV